MNGNTFLIQPGGGLAPMAGGASLAVTADLYHRRARADIAQHSVKRADGQPANPMDHLHVPFVASVMAGLRRHADSVGIRADAFDPGLGGAPSRQLTQQLAEILREPVAPNTALSIFPINTELKPGALSYTFRRHFQAGEAGLYRGGSGASIPRVETGQSESAQRPVHIFAIAVESDFRQVAHGDFAGFDDFGEKLRAAGEILDKTVNDLIWQGSNDADLWGVFNYPHLDVQISQTPISTSGSADNIIEAVTALLMYAFTNSKTALKSDSVAMAPNIARYLTTTYPDNKGGKSLMKLIQEGVEQFYPAANWHVAQELQGAGPGSESGILAFSSAKRGFEIMQSLPKTVIAGAQDGLSSTTYMVRGMGGVRAPHVGANVLGWFDT